MKGTKKLCYIRLVTSIALLCFGVNGKILAIKTLLFIAFSHCCLLVLENYCTISHCHENIICTILTQMDTGRLTQSNAY